MVCANCHMPEVPARHALNERLTAHGVGPQRFGGSKPGQKGKVHHG